MKTIIHGENIITPVTSLPKGSKTVAQYIIGHSETGHNHILIAEKGSEFRIIEKDGNIFFETTKPATIVHQKTQDIHQTVTVEPGIYKVFHAVEYNPFTKQLQRVFD